MTRLAIMMMHHLLFCDVAEITTLHIRLHALVTIFHMMLAILPTNPRHSVVLFWYNVVMALHCGVALCSLAFPPSALEAPEALAALVWRVVTNAASIIHRGARGQCYTISLCESFFVWENILTAKSIHRPLQGGRGGTMLDNLQRATFVRADVPSV